MALGTIFRALRRWATRRSKIYRDRNGMLVICMYCRRTLRHAPGPSQWEMVPEHVRESQPNVSHGICPECCEEQYRNLRTL